MKLPRVYADFNKQDKEGHLVLNSVGTQRDLQQLGLTLRDGLKLLLYADDTDENGNPDDIEVEGVVRYDSANNQWIAVYQQTAIRHASEKVDDSSS